MAPRILISLGTYNERDNLPDLVTAIHEQVPGADVLVIDDDSPDGTGRVADQMAAADPRIRVLHRPGKLGLGSAIVRAMRYAIAHGYDYLVNMDADFSHHPRYLPVLLSAAAERCEPARSASEGRADVVIGSRYVPGAGIKNWAWHRQVGSRAVNGLARLLLRIPARDTSGGYRCYRVEKLRAIDLDRIWSRGYSFQEEMLYRCCRIGCRVAETPIVFENRRNGKSKLGLKEIVQSLGVVFGLGVMALSGWEAVTPKNSEAATR